MLFVHNPFDCTLIWNAASGTSVYLTVDPTVKDCAVLGHPVPDTALPDVSTGVTVKVPISEPFVVIVTSTI
jgi:hypothetical protein